MKNGECGRSAAALDLSTLSERAPWRRRAARAGVTAAVALVVLGACTTSVTKQLDTAKGEEIIRNHLQGGIDATVDGVSCPEREVQQGDVFECTARVDGQPLRLRVTQDDDQGNISIEPVQAILNMKEAVALIEQQVGQAKRVAVQADCGTQSYLVKDPGSTFDCGVRAKKGRASNRVVVTVKDVEGNVDLRLV